MSAFNPNAHFISGKINGGYSCFPVSGWPIAFQFRPQEKQHFQGYNPLYKCDMYTVTLDIDVGDTWDDGSCAPVKCKIYVPDWRLEEYFKNGIFVEDEPVRQVKSASFTKMSS